jgi:hypothetical protein
MWGMEKPGSRLDEHWGKLICGKVWERKVSEFSKDQFQVSGFKKPVSSFRFRVSSF